MKELLEVQLREQLNGIVQDDKGLILFFSPGKYASICSKNVEDPSEALALFLNEVFKFNKNEVNKVIDLIDDIVISRVERLAE